MIPWAFMATRSELKRGIEAIRRRFYADPHGFQLEQALCSMMDGVLEEIWKDFESPVRFSVMAVGGYGRGTLHPESDLDLLLFFEDEVDQDVVNGLFNLTTQAIQHLLSLDKQEIAQELANQAHDILLDYDDDLADLIRRQAFPPER